MANTLACLLVGSFFLFVANAASVNDTICLDMFSTFGSCLSNSTDKKKDDKVKKFGQKIQKCFDDKKCDAPDFEQDPFSNSTVAVKEMAKLVHETWEKTPDTVKICFQRQFRVFLMKKLNECLKQQKVDEVKLDADEVQDVFERAFKIGNFTAEDKKGHKDNKGVKAFFNTIISLKHCLKDQGRDAVNGTIQCIGGVKDDARTEVCKVIKSCKKDSFSEACQKRGKEIEKAICTCQLDKLKEVKKRLDKLQKDGKKHPAADFKGILGDDFEDDKKEALASIKDCFLDNKIEPPHPLDFVLFGILFATHPEHKGPHVILPMMSIAVNQDNDESSDVSADQIWFFNQLVGNLIKHNECGCD